MQHPGVAACWGVEVDPVKCSKGRAYIGKQPLSCIHPLTHSKLPWLIAAPGCLAAGAW